MRLTGFMAVLRFFAVKRSRRKHELHSGLLRMVFVVRIYVCVCNSNKLRTALPVYKSYSPVCLNTWWEG